MGAVHWQRLIAIARCSLPGAALVIASSTIMPWKGRYPTRRLLQESAQRLSPGSGGATATSSNLCLMTIAR